VAGLLQLELANRLALGLVTRKVICKLLGSPLRDEPTLFVPVLGEAGLAAIGVVRALGERDAKIRSGVGVAPEESCEAGGRAAEPHATPRTQNAAQGVLSAADAEAMLRGDAGADDLRTRAQLLLFGEIAFTFALRAFHPACRERYRFAALAALVVVMVHARENKLHVMEVRAFPKRTFFLRCFGVDGVITPLERALVRRNVLGQLRQGVVACSFVLGPLP